MKCLVLLVMFVMTSVFAADTFNVDAAGSNLKWKGSKVTGTHFGKIAFESGTISVEDGNLTAADFTVDMNSMTCDDLQGEFHDKLIGHLKNDDFFSVAKFKTANLKIDKAVKEKNGEFTYSGTLTIKGKSNPVKFKGNLVVEGNTVKSEGKLTFDRTTFDVKYNSGKFFQNLGDKLISDSIELSYSVTAQK